MTRNEALRLYRPIRAGIQRVLKAALHTCNAADWKRGATQLGVWSPGRIEVQDESALDMVADVGLFEPNQRGRRSYDRFLERQGKDLDPADLDLAERMRSARFPVFRIIGRHELAGVWVDDVLNESQRIWILDQGLEASAPTGLEFGLRLFDAGQFHAGFGIVVPADEEFTRLCIQARRKGDRLPVRHSLAASLYAEAIWADTMAAVEQELANMMRQPRERRRSSTRTR